PTTAPALTALMRELAAEGEVLAGQEVGTLTYLVHDAVTAAGTTILSFNAHQLRIIAASRKKTHRRDAYWIAKALQSGMYPHPVYVPSGEIRDLRALLSQRRVLHADYQSWRYRARAYLRAAGCPAPGDCRLAGDARAREWTHGGSSRRRARALSAVGGDAAGGAPAGGHGAGEPGRLARRCPAAHDHPGRRRARRDRDLCLGRGREALPDGEEVSGVRWVGPDSAPEWRGGPGGPHHEAGRTRLADRPGPGESCAARPVSACRGGAAANEPPPYPRR